MGREVKRVPLDFEWPLRQVWEGFVMPGHLTEVSCLKCTYDQSSSGTGYSPRANQLKNQWYGNAPFDPESTGSVPLSADTPAVRAFAERNVANAPDFYGTGSFAVWREAWRLARLWNGAWCHHLAQEDVDVLIAAERLRDFTHTFIPGAGWQPHDSPVTVTAAQVNAWSLTGFGHDSINCYIVINARCAREGVSSTCSACDGHGSTEAYPGQRAEADAWVPIEPRTGDGFQLWETVSEGSPVSPVFATAEELATWMSQPNHPGTIDPITYERALAFITTAGWAPSLIASPAHGVEEGVTAVGRASTERDG